jgi:hypothetical protein
MMKSLIVVLVAFIGLVAFTFVLTTAAGLLFGAATGDVAASTGEPSFGVIVRDLISAISGSR